MKRRLFQTIIFCSGILCLMSLTYCFKQTTQEVMMINKAFDVQKIVSLFSLGADDINRSIDVHLQQAQETIDAILMIPNGQRTFSNTVKALDELMSLSDLAIAERVYEALELVSPEKEVRDAAHNAFIKGQRFWIEQLTGNKKLYNAFMAYVDLQKEDEQLSDQQRYFIETMIKDFKQEGLSLSDETLEKVKNLKNKLSELVADFDRNIAEDNSFIAVDYDDLQGLDGAFINALKKNDDGTFILGVDYPTYFRVMENCSVAQTRKRLAILFDNRAYPINDELLKKIIIMRDELAHLLGYSDFASLNIDNQMAQSPERARLFLDDLIEKTLPKVRAEKKLLTKKLPESVVLDNDGNIHKYDMLFLENYYKKTHFAIDEQKIAEYFPMKKTIDELLDIYRQFFSIQFKEVTPSQGLWHEDVLVVQVFDKEGKELLGTLLLDLYPRPNKYSHACHTTIIPATFKENGIRIPDVSLVIANFAKSTDSQPSLLQRNEVQTFFHEFGHALHAILGATEIASLSGTHTKRDFVELPSQMLEEWLWNKDILKKVSGHYQTGEPLSDELIDAIVSVKDLTSGYFVLRQTFLATFALSCFEAGKNKDPYQILKDTHLRIMSHVTAYSPDNHFYASFGHLTGYAAKYYGYLWSKVFALDIFAEIKKHGLLDPEIGQKYKAAILSKGGAQDPNELLYNFLGREPSAQAFFDEMGL